MKADKKDRKKSGIYCIKCLNNGRIYIGKSKNIYKRIIQHVSLLNSQSKDENRHLINAWFKYGRENFEYSVLEYLELDENLLAQRELFWIKEKNALDRSIGFNLRLDSETKMIVSDETRVRLRLASIGRRERYPHLLDAIRKGAEKRKQNPVTMSNMAKAVSQAKTKYTIVQFTKEFVEFASYSTHMELKEKCPEYHAPAILSVCNGWKNSYKGFLWRYRCIKTLRIIEPDSSIRKSKRPKDLPKKFRLSVTRGKKKVIFSNSFGEDFFITFGIQEACEELNCTQGTIKRACDFPQKKNRLPYKLRFYKTEDIVELPQRENKFLSPAFYSE